MIRGPQKDARPAGQSFVDKVSNSYEKLDEWLIELASLADREGLAGAAKRIGYSKAAVSTVLNGKYAGDVDRVEQMVRGALMAEQVDCPVLGDIGRDRCLSEQKEEFRGTSAFRAQLYHACRGGCPHASKKGEL